MQIRQTHTHHSVNGAHFVKPVDNYCCRTFKNSISYHHGDCAQRKYQNKTTNVYTKRLKSNRKIIIGLKETMCLMLFNVYVQCANVALSKGHVIWFNKLVFVCVYMSFFSFSFYLKRKNKKSNQILANPKVDWLKYMITSIRTSIHVYFLVFCFAYHCSISLSLDVCKQSR